MNDRNALKAGIFIVFSIVLIVSIIVGIRGLGRFLEPVQTARVHFQLSDDIGGLSVGDEVRIGGAKVGVVRSVEFIDHPSIDPLLAIEFTMPSRFVIKRDAEVSIQSTVTGVSVLNFSSLGRGQPLPEDEALVGQPAALAALLESGPEIVGMVRDLRTVTIPRINTAIESYRQTSQGATELISTVRGKVDPVVERYNGVADTAKVTLAHLNDIFGDTKVDIRTVVANVRDTTGIVKQRLPGMLDKVDAVLVGVTSSIDMAKQSLEDVKVITTNAKDTSATVRQVLNTNRGRIDAILLSLKGTADNLKGASAEIRHSPWRLLYRPTGGEMANLNLYDSARQFADGATQLNDAATSLRDALKDPEVSPQQIQRLVEKLDQTFTNFNEMEAALWTQVKE